MPRSLRLPALVYGLLSLVLWPSPLLGLLHVEASAVVAAAGFFVAGLAAIQAFQQQASLRRVLTGHLALLVVPWALLTSTLLFRPNCGYLAGVGFYLLFAVPSVVLGVALAYALTGLRLRWPRAAFVALGLGIAAGGVLLDLGFHPQFYTYNHVFGGVLGPIYDEELAVRPGLFAFRALTGLWAIGLVSFGRWLRLRSVERAGAERRRTVQAGALIAGLIAAAYAFAPALGIVTTPAQLDAALPGRLDLEHFVLHYQPGSLTEAELAWIADEHRYRYEQLRRQLGVEVEAPIHTYLYPDPETRARLTGSRETSVTPVWLATPQLHMLADRFTAEHFGHELAHVFSREFGAPLLRASPAVGLVEGLAVAMQPPDGLPTATQQVAASLRLEEADLGALEARPAEALVGAMSPFGFWTGRGTVSYATTGSFARWLLDQYGAERLRSVYRTADFESVYEQPLAALATAWEAELRAEPASPEAEALARWRFQQPSLFERRCPHHVPPAVRFARDAFDAEQEGRAADALRLYTRALDADTAYLPALVGWARRRGAVQEDVETVIRRLDAAQDSIPNPALLVARGDAHRIAGDSSAAAAAYEEALSALPPYARFDRVAVALRATLSVPHLRQLLAAGDAADRARGLDALGQPEAALFTAALWQAAGEPQRALAALGEEPSWERLRPEIAAEAAAVWPMARALMADRARAYREALAYANAAAQAFRQLGADGPGRRMNDLAAKAHWFMERGE
ncbi:MAG: hypothetical protein HKN04_15000 [Rhodothermaceae bacterium]|nr:hypothetical protein [Rhodothermaceae bacterium]